MKIIYTKTFLKDLAKVAPAKRRLQIERFVFELLASATSIESVGSIEKMKGYKNYYKIRFGEYRVGLSISNSVVEIKRVLNRKEIYKYFP
jgi:mRNA interferase RelE/StbE